MSIHIFLIAALPFLMTSSAWALTYEIRSSDTEIILTGGWTDPLEGQSVGEITQSVLSSAQRDGFLTYQGSTAGVTSINGLGNSIEVVSDREMKAYGWCYSLNGVVPEDMADQYFFTSDEDHLIWFYAYAHSLDGSWVAQCVPAGT